MPVHHVESSEKFTEILLNENQSVHDKPFVLVDFYADWCGPCRRIAPQLEKLSGTYGDKVLFLKVNIEECQESADSCKVHALPTFMFFESGRLSSDYQQIVGANIAAVEERLKNLGTKPSDKISDDF